MAVWAGETGPLSGDGDARCAFSVGCPVVGTKGGRARQDVPLAGLLLVRGCIHLEGNADEHPQ